MRGKVTNDINKKYIHTTAHNRMGKRYQTVPTKINNK